MNTLFIHANQQVDHSLSARSDIYIQHLILPPEAYGHRPCDKSPCEAPQREDGDNNCPDQSHLVVLQLDVPALQECLIDKGLNKL